MRHHIFNDRIGKHVSIRVLPDRIAQDYLERHIHRTDLHDGITTCLVESGGNWTAKPDDASALSWIEEATKGGKIFEGEKNYPVPQHFFHRVRSRKFLANGIATGESGPAAFRIRCAKIDGRAQPLLACLDRKCDKLTPDERGEIKERLKKICKAEDDVQIWVIDHVHIVPSG